MEENISFVDLVNVDKWSDLPTFIKENDPNLENDIKESIKFRKKLREKLLSDPEFRSRIKRVSEDDLKWAEKQLLENNVCAADGTVSIFPMVSGGRARIGVVVTSYQNDKIEKILFISERQLMKKFDDPIKHFKELVSVRRKSGMVIRAIMLFGERQLILKRKEEWKFVHGDLLPFELRTGLGKIRALDECLHLASKMIENKKVIGVIEGSQENIDLLNAGETLEKFEYLKLRGLDIDLNQYIYGDEERGITPARFNPEDRETMEKFIKNFGKHIFVGIFKVGMKPYIFQAHEEYFDKAAALVMKDASHQPMRGFPLLIDYADQICSKMLASQDFERQVMFKTAKISQETLGFEIDARKTRRR